MSEGAAAAGTPRQLVRGLGFWDCTMIVAGSMIGSGIFIVPAEIARQVGSAGWILAVWLITGLLTMAGALSYGELAAMMPRAGGQYVYLREAYSPLWGFLYGWTLFLVIQTGTIAAVAVAFARFLGVLVPAVSPTAWIVEPIHLSDTYAVSLSLQQLVAVALIVALTIINCRGLALGKWIQNVFTSVKTLALLGLVLVGLIAGANADALQANFSDPWTPKGVLEIKPDVGWLAGLLPAVSAAGGALGLAIALCVSQVGSLFSADSWHSVTFAAEEVREPRRDLPRALAAGAGLVIALYLLANVSYLVTLPVSSIQKAPDDRVGTALLQAVFHDAGAVVMAAAILISTFGCNNGLILSGARVYYAMARDGLFFRAAGRLNARQVPAAGLVLQCAWAALLVLPRTILRDPQTGFPSYGNLYSNLLDYVVFSVLIFYVLTTAGIFVLRRKRPDAERPHRALGYPVVPALYIAAASVILAALLCYRTDTTWPGLLIVLMGVPVYLLWRKSGSSAAPPAAEPVPDPARRP